MAVLLALGSALAYGLSDFLGGLLSRRSSAWQVAVVAQIASTLCTGAVALFVDGTARPVDFAWAVLAGVGSGVGTAFLYRGFAAGRMGVVAPISAVGAALVPALAGVVGGERPTLLVWVGIVAALPGIWLVSSLPPDQAKASESGGSSTAAGVLDGALAGLGFGVLFAAIGQVPEASGWWPLTLTQAVSLPAVIVLAVCLRAPWVPRSRTAYLAVAAGPLGATATGLFLLATQQGLLTVAGVLTSLYPASTVLLAAVLLHERVHRSQGLGLVLCGLAVGFVAGG